MGDFSPLGWIPLGNLLNELLVGIGFAFTKDEHGSLYSHGRAAGTIIAIGLEVVFGLFGFGFIPFNTIRVAILVMMNYLA